MKFEIIFWAVIEVANGDFGDYTDRLVEAAAAEESFILSRNGIQLNESISMEEQLSSPTEWQRFLYLLGRCHVHYHRDWVRQ